MVLRRRRELPFADPAREIELYTHVESRLELDQCLYELAQVGREVGRCTKIASLGERLTMASGAGIGSAFVPSGFAREVLYQS